MSDAKIQYGWGTSEEGGYHGKFESREDAMRDSAGSEFYGDDHETMTVWTCEIKEIDMSDLLPCWDWIFEFMQERLSEECGEWAENFDPTKEQVAKFMRGMEVAVAESGMDPGCWAAEALQSHEVDKDGNEVKDG